MPMHFPDIERQLIILIIHHKATLKSRLAPGSKELTQWRKVHTWVHILTEIKALHCSVRLQWEYKCILCSYNHVSINQLSQFP
jgi:hypothetical protein